MIQLLVSLEEIKPGVMMLYCKPGEATQNQTEAEELAADRIHKHIESALEEEQKRMAEDGWAESISGPASVLDDAAIEAAKRRHQK